MQQIKTLQQTKLATIAAKLGIPQVANGQQTERVIFDSVALNGGTAPATQTLEFFQNFAGKTPEESNVQSSKLDSNEALIIKNIKLFTFDESMEVAASMPLLNVYVGGQRVIKDLSFAFATDELTPENIVKIGFGQDGTASSMRLLTNIVVPPQVEIKVTVKLLPLANDARVYLILGGYGVLFNPQSSL